MSGWSKQARYCELRVNTHGFVDIVPGSYSTVPIEHGANMAEKTIGCMTYVYRTDIHADLYSRFFKNIEKLLLK